MKYLLNKYFISDGGQLITLEAGGIYFSH